VDGDFPRRGEPSTAISVELDMEGDAPEARLAELVDLVDGIAEIPSSIRSTTPITITSRRLVGSDSRSQASPVITASK
jgi:hypothetical protein